MDPALHEAVLQVRADIQITPKHNTMDQHTNLFDAQFTPNHNPMDPSLYNAIKDGKVEDLDQYTDVFDTQLTPNHNTILHVAAHFGKSECVTKILEKKPWLLRRVNANCENPLHIAVRERHYVVVRALIERARRLDLEPESGAGTRLEILRAINVEGDTALHLAVREEDAKIVGFLVGEDPDFQHPLNKAEETPLYLAAKRKNGDSMVESILAFSKSPAYTGPGGRTALHTTVIFLNTESLKKLLDRNEELIDKADTEGWTPLHYAAYNGNRGVVRELLKRNKSVGYTRTSEKHNKNTALHIAVARGSRVVMEEILYHCPDSWEMVNSKGRNILHIAVDMGQKHLISYIIKKDWLLESLMNRKDCEGNTPIHLLVSTEIFNFKWKDNPINHPRANKYAFNNKNKTPGDLPLLATKVESSRGRLVRGRRNMAKGEEQETRKKRRKEYKEKFRAKKAEAAKKTSKSLMLVATLIATITFAAAFAIPGGYDGNQGSEQGMAILVRRASFKAFVIANTTAVMCSTSSVVYYVFAAFYYFDEHEQGQRYAKGFYLVLIAIVAMTVGFISGTYAMLIHCLGLAISTSIIASFTFLIYNAKLIRIISLWYSSLFPWQRVE